MARPTLYEKFEQQIGFANKTRDPKLRDLAIEAADDYFKLDLTKEAERLPLGFMIVTIVMFIMVAGSAFSIIKYLGGWECLYIFIILFAFLPFFVGAYMRMVGKIQETTFIH